MDDLLRIYFDPDEIDADSGYPWQWKIGVRTLDGDPVGAEKRRIPDLVREQAGHRCVRCSHPFVVSETPGRWSPCDDLCFVNDRHSFDPETSRTRWEYDGESGEGIEIVEAQWRVLTVHHLNGIKHDCRWWNVASLCQRCHLTIQAKVYMERPWTRPHSEWFKPYVAGFYAWSFLGEELTREQTMERLDELLALEHRQLALGET